MDVATGSQAWRGHPQSSGTPVSPPPDAAPCKTVTINGLPWRTVLGVPVQERSAGRSGRDEVARLAPPERLDVVHELVGESRNGLPARPGDVRREDEVREVDDAH